MEHLSIRYNIYSMNDLIRHYQDKTGGHWFSKDTMRFFKSRVSSSLLYGQRHIVFFSSELGPHQIKRRYSIRCYEPDTGEISTIGLGFQGYKTLAAAKLAAKKLIGEL